MNYKGVIIEESLENKTILISQNQVLMLYYPQSWISFDVIG